jgi:hypothetical protein
MSASEDSNTGTDPWREANAEAVSIRRLATAFKVTSEVPFSA